MFSQAMAQYYYDGRLRKGFSMGVMGSVNSIWIINQNNYGTLEKFQDTLVRGSELAYEFTWGGKVGAELLYNFHKKWGLSFQPSYSWAGQKYNDDMWGPVGVPKTKDTAQAWYVPAKGARYTNVKRVIKSNYIELPLLARFQINVGEITNFYVAVGPQIGIATVITEDVKIKNAVYISDNGLTIKDKFNKIDAGVLLNFGMDFYANEQLYFNLGLTNYFGIMDINGKTIKNIDWFSKNDIKYQQSRNLHTGLQVGIHYYFVKSRYY